MRSTGLNEAGDIGWNLLADGVDLVDRGEIIGAATVVADYRAFSLPIA